MMIAAKVGVKMPNGTSGINSSVMKVEVVLVSMEIEEEEIEKVEIALRHHHLQ